MSNDNSTSTILQLLYQIQSTENNSERITAASVYSPSAIKASLIILGLQMGLTFFSNISLFVSLRNSRQRKTVYQELLQNLCLIGTLSSLIGMPSLFATIFISFVKWRSVPSFLCRTRYFSLTYFFITDSLNICLLSLERYDFLSRPFRKRITKENITRYICIIWVIPLFIALLHLVIKIKSSHCVLLASTEGPYSQPMVLLFSVILILTCSVVVITNWLSFKSMRTLARRLNASRRNRARSEKKMIYFTINIVATYLVSLVPMALWTVVLRVGGIRDCLLCNDMQIYLQLLTFVRYMANPFIFMRFAWKRKQSKIGVLKKDTSTRCRNREAVNQNAQPFLVFPSPAHDISFGGSHRINRRTAMQALCLNQIRSRQTLSV